MQLHDKDFPINPLLLKAGMTDECSYTIKTFQLILYCEKQAQQMNALTR